MIATASVRADAPDPAGAIARRLGRQGFSMVLFFASPGNDFAYLARRLDALFPGAATIGCTTAGEIGSAGYADGTVVAVGLPEARFAARPVIVEDLSAPLGDEVASGVLECRMALARAHPRFTNGFAFLAVDGLSTREEIVLGAIAPGLGAMPLFGGSAGDGRAFGRTRLACNGRLLDNAAVIAPIMTDCDTRVFSLDHIAPLPVRMVVTDADPERRLVREINGAPAAAEYARLIGHDPARLDRMTFTDHPVAVRLGADHHVRAIRGVAEDGALVFHAAVDTGMVLSTARAGDMARHLDDTLAGMGRARPPADILACDCLLRRLEAERHGLVGRISDILVRHRVVGYCTYGEQIGSLHVNQTMTGVALYPPPPR